MVNEILIVGCSRTPCCSSALSQLYLRIACSEGVRHLFRHGRSTIISYRRESTLVIEISRSKVAVFRLCVAAVAFCGFVTFDTRLGADCLCEKRCLQTTCHCAFVNFETQCVQFKIAGNTVKHATTDTWCVPGADCIATALFAATGLTVERWFCDDCTETCSPAGCAVNFPNTEGAKDCGRCILIDTLPQRVCVLDGG